MSKIYELPLKFRLVKKYICFTFRQFYSEYIVLGRENIPNEGPVIFAPNHLNALMDALAIHSISPDNYATVFLARSDMFKKKAVADFLTFAKIMPAFRIRDGIENLGKNAEVFDRCVEVLETNNAMGIMPEGNQELERKIRPLVKGIFRVAFSAQQKLGTSKSVKIVPVGIDMGSLFKFGKHIIINVGKPMNVVDYMGDYNENPVLATNKIRDDLKKNLENLVLHLGTEKYYKTFETTTEIANKAMLKELRMKDNTVNQFYARQEIGKRLVKLELENSTKIEKLNLLCNEFENLRSTLSIQIQNFDRKELNFSDIFFKSILLLITSPLFIIGYIYNFLAFYTPVFIRKKLNVKFEGFFTSLHFGIGILSFPIFYILQSILLLTIMDLAWYFILLFIPLGFFSGKWAFRYYKIFRKLIGQIQHESIKKRNEVEFNRLLELRKSIIDTVIE